MSLLSSVFHEFRVDAFYKCDRADVDPVEYAVLRSDDVEEALAVLKEFVQIPDQVKFEKLWRLLRYGASKISRRCSAACLSTW